MAENFTSIWVFAANVAETKGEQGFLTVPESVAKKLIDEGSAQDPSEGGFFLNELEDPTASAPKKKNGKPPKAAEPESAPEPPKVEPAPVVTKQIAPEPALVANYKTK